MILVDSSVWIDWILDRDTAATRRLDELLDTPETLCICDRVLQEVLQGIRDDKHAREVSKQLAIFECVDSGGADLARLSAELYRGLRKRGVTIRSSIDTLIAALCIERGVKLLHSDRDFDAIAKHSALQVERT